MSQTAADTTNILFIDDEARILEVYKTMLEEKGYRVSATSRADEAVRLVSQTEYDFVFLVLRPRHGMNINLP